MKKFLTVLMAAALVVGASSVVYANVCAVDQVPAATLLYPFVAYDYNDTTGNSDTTLIAVTNVSSEATIVHFTLWSDYSTHVLDWDVILSGYDVQTINVRDILRDGQLPITGTGEDPDAIDNVWDAGFYTEPNGIESYGPMKSQVDTFYALPLGEATYETDAETFPKQDDTGLVCPPTDIAYPGLYKYPIPGSTLALIQQWLQVSQTVPRAHDADCSGVASGIGDWFENRDTTSPTWMYITADVVNDCSTLWPDTDATSYFGAGGIAEERNVLIGDIFYVNNNQNLSEAVPAVHLEADPNYVFDPHPITDQPLTFYTQYSGGLDAREPLPQAWAFRYIGRNDASMGTMVRVFKRASRNPDVTETWWTPGHTSDLFLGVSDGLGGYIAAGQDEQPEVLWARDCEPYAYYAWDEDENVILSEAPPQWTPPPYSCPPGDPECQPPVFIPAEQPNLLPLETQEVPIEWFTAPDGSGWVLLTFPFANGPGFDVYQTYVSVKYNAYGNYSAALPAAVMANYACFGEMLPTLNITAYPNN